MAGRLTDRVAIVTGGTGGIGAAIVRRFATEGADVVLCMRRSLDAGLSLVDEVRRLGRRSLSLQVDISNADQVDGLIQQTLEMFGRLDILINNAGVVCDALIVRMKDEEWDRVLDVNLKGAFHTIRAASRPMIKARYGRIINVTSVVGLIGNPGQANYVAAKAGLIGFTKSAARELASRGITVNAVAPGYVAAGMTERLSQEVRDAYLARIPLGRACSPEEVAALVTFLASEEAAYITGQVIAIDGGMVM
ncbi:MAG: 3-oxoacyl-[acyl-carrier-protein] reductase [Candidatus Latescibacteria bacterium]|nr:3-oxoacyl-[acyl-carrier-protein] reductase [Candidatus Latescibacterota bacterium]